MKTYATIATKNYGMGRLCVVADHFSGYHNGYGRGNPLLWRKIFEWTGQCETDETIKIGLLNYTSNNISNLYDISPVNVRDINAHNITAGDVSDLDVLYIIGNNNVMDADCQNTIATLADSGMGVLVEYPFGNTYIDALMGVGSIPVESVQRPVLGQAYWTVAGQSNYLYTPDAVVKTFESVPIDAFDNTWTIILSTAPVETINVSTGLDSSSESSSSFGGYLYHGIVDTRLDCGYDDASSLSSEILSSSSGELTFDLCDNLEAYWHLDDNGHGSIVRDDVNLLNMGTIYHNTTPYNTNAISTTGHINRCFAMNSGIYVETIPSTMLRFNTGINDLPFSVSLWAKISAANSVFICKKDVWSFGCNAARQVYIIRWDMSGHHVVYSTYMTLTLSEWAHIVINYAPLSAPSFFIDGIAHSFYTSDTGYTGVNTRTSVTYLGTNSTQYLHGSLDEVAVFNRVLSSSEVKYLYNHGNGVSSCEGVWTP